MGRHGVTRRAGRLGRAGRGVALAGLVALPLVGLGAAAGHAQPAPRALVPGTPCAVTVRACVDLNEGEAWLVDRGAVTYGPVLVSSGAEGEETPTGTFRVEWKHLDHISGESGVPMPYSVFFAPGGIAFHEGSIYIESAGCVHLHREDAKAFFDTLAVGDPVEVR